MEYSIELISTKIKNIFVCRYHEVFLLNNCPVNNNNFIMTIFLFRQFRRERMGLMKKKTLIVLIPEVT